MKFLAIKNNSIGILSVLILQDNSFKTSFLAYNYTIESVFKHFLSKGRVVVERRTSDRTIQKHEVKQDDFGYFEALKTKLPAPYAVYVSGEIDETTPQEALLKLWKMFSVKPPRQPIEVQNVKKSWRSS
jgi:hypothetical protein